MASHDYNHFPVIVPCFVHQYRLGVRIRFKVRFKVRVCIYVYGGIQLTLQYTIISITYILTFTILVRETWNDYRLSTA